MQKNPQYILLIVELSGDDNILVGGFGVFGNSVVQDDVVMRAGPSWGDQAGFVHPHRSGRPIRCWRRSFTLSEVQLHSASSVDGRCWD